MTNSSLVDSKLGVSNRTSFNKIRQVSYQNYAIESSTNTPKTIYIEAFEKWIKNNML